MKQNQHFQKTACFTVTIWKIMYFHTMNKFKENEQFSVVLSIGQQNEHFQEIACSRVVSLHQILWILRKLANLSDLTEITDSNGISKDSLLPFVVLV